MSNNLKGWQTAIRSNFRNDLSPFEKWCVDNGFSVRLRDDPDSSDKYFAYETQQRWIVWQAAMDSK